MNAPICRPKEVITVDESFWKNSPSPEPEDGEEGEEWGFEVVGEEVDGKGEVRYVLIKSELTLAIAAAHPYAYSQI